ncbi:MAG: hypothetical protein AMDU1_APLC00004G0033 [Thermoplasmatales archaeon A-plasma]|jgi:hypothetical protein|nr:MAG: hypothetical protein AMDU1_APLC00004G0033 [Thermoplasmatales archaeon A-plasma]
MGFGNLEFAFIRAVKKFCHIYTSSCIVDMLNFEPANYLGFYII